MSLEEVFAVEVCGEVWGDELGVLAAGLREISMNGGQVLEL